MERIRSTDATRMTRTDWAQVFDDIMMLLMMLMMMLMIMMIVRDIGVCMEKKRRARMCVG